MGSTPRLVALAATAITLACGGDELTLPDEGQPAELTVVRGNGQNGTVGEALADSLVVRVRDRFGNPVPDVEVRWTPEGGGSVDPAMAVTDGGGRAGTQRTLGLQPGTYTTVASVAELPEEPVVFTTTGVAAKLSIVTQPSAAAVSGVPLEQQPVLQLLDADGNAAARAGVLVTVQIATGGGSLGGSTSVPSDATGLVTYTDLSIRGEPGIRTLLFAADAFASAASAPIAVGVGAAASIEIAEGNEQSATVNTAVAAPPGAVVRDADGNPLSGVPVTFRVASGGGSITGGTTATGSDGVARVGSWTLGTAAGPNTLEALVPGLDLDGSPAVATATGVAGPLDVRQSSIAAAPGSIGASSGGTTSTITVTARDGFGNPVRDLPVTLAATGSGNVLTQPQAATDAAGAATGRLAATAAGPHVVSATISGQPIPATATVTVTAAAPAAANSSAIVGNGTAGSSTTIRVELEDAFGNLVGGAGGRISVSVTGANTAIGQPAQDLGGGQYDVEYTPRIVGTDQIVVRVDGTPLPGPALTSFVSPGAASPVTTTAALPAEATVFQEIAVVVTIRDAEGNVRTVGGDQVRVVVLNSPVDQSPGHNGDGTYTARFFPPALGTIQVQVTVNGAEIAGSPFSMEITLF